MVWKRSLGVGYSGVSVAGGTAVTLYASATDDVLAAFDAASGAPRWELRLGARTTWTRPTAESGSVSYQSVSTSGPSSTWRGTDLFFLTEDEGADPNPTYRLRVDGNIPETFSRYPGVLPDLAEVIGQ